MWKLSFKRIVLIFHRKPYFCSHSKPCYMRKYSFLVCLMLLASVLFISCKEEGFEQARLLVANVSLTPPLSPSPLPTAGFPIDVRWDGTFIIPSIIYGAASITTGSPLTSVTNPQFVTANYAPVKSGAYGLNFAISGQGGTNGVTIYNRTTSFLPGRSYSAIAFDFNPFYKTIIMEDDLTAPPAGKVKVRFIHAIPQNILASVPRKDTIDVTASGGAIANPLVNASVFSLRNFADAYSNNRLHQFAVLDSGRYNIGFRIAGTPGTSQATGLLGLFPNQRLQEGKIYTIIARVNIPGLPTGAAAGLTIITHN
jgi:hypothetical protein